MDSKSRRKRVSLSLKELNKKLADPTIMPLEKKRLQDEYNRANYVQDTRRTKD